MEPQDIGPVLTQITSPALPERARLRGIGWAVIGAILGFLILPAIPAIIWSIVIGVRSWRRHHRRHLMAACAIALVAILSVGCGVWTATNIVRDTDLLLQAGSLAPAVNRYYEHEHGLPDDFRVIVDSGLYGLNQYKWDRLAYLPVTHWDGKTQTVVAVVGGEGGRLGCVVLGDYGFQRVRWEELDALLAGDDETRARQGEPRRWSSIDWRTPLKP